MTKRASVVSARGPACQMRRRFAMAAVFISLIAGAAVVPAIALAAAPHEPYDSSTNSCGACHRSHQGAPIPGLLSMDASERAPLDETVLCYKCHSGTGSRTNVKNGPVNSFTGSSGHALEALASEETTPDLTTACSSCHYPHGDWRLRPRLPKAELNRASVPGADNSWCFACHNDANDWYGESYPDVISPARDATGYPTVGTFPGPSVYNDPSKNAHASIPASTVPDPMMPSGTPTGASWEATRVAGDCLWCHASHRSSSSYDGLVAEYRPSTASPEEVNSGEYAAVCFTCHAPGGQAADIKSLVTGSASSGHSIRSSESTLPVGADLPCYECHNPHGSKRGNASLISDTLGGGLETTTTAGVRAFCFTCHTSNDAAPYAWDSDAGTMTIDAALGEVVGIPRTAGVLRLPSGAYHSKDGAISCATCHGDIHDPVDVDGDLATTHQLRTTSGFVGALSNHMGYAPAGIVVTCSDCHRSDDLIRLHGSSPDNCGLCHAQGAPRTTFTDWNGTCQQGGCHPTTHDISAEDAAHSLPSMDVNCQYCHAEVQTPGGWYDDVELYGCQRCHDHSANLAWTAPVATTSDAADYYLGPAVITLSASGSSSVTETFYRLDDGSWTRGTAPTTRVTVSDEGSHVLRFYSIADGWQAEEVRQVAVVVDTIAPRADTVRINEGGGITTSTDVRINSFVSDAGSGVTSMSVDPGTGVFGDWVAFEWTYPTTLPVGDGTKTIQVRYMDAAGNVSSIVSDTIVLDQNPPTAAMVLNEGAAVTTSLEVTVTSSATDTATDVSGIRIDRGDGDWTPWMAYAARLRTGLLPLPQEDGEKTVHAQYMDAAGNVSEATSDTIILDYNPPVGTMTVNGGAAAASSTAVTVESSMTDAGSGVARMLVLANGDVVGTGWLPYAAGTPINLAGTDGWKVVTVWYMDGNDHLAARNYSILLDTQAPATSSDAAPYYGSGPATISLTASDTGSGVQATYFNLDGVTGAGTVVSVSSTGSHTLEFWSVDEAGNVEPTQTVTFSVGGGVDTAPPTTTSNAALYYAGTAEIILTGSDNAGGSGVASTHFELDGGATTAGTLASTSVEGWHTLRFWSVDNAGNIEATSEAKFYVDATAPTTRSSAAQSYVGGATIWLWGEDDYSSQSMDLPGSGLKATYYRLDDGATTAGAVVSTDLEGAHTVEFWSVDNAGNAEEHQFASFRVLAPDTVLRFSTHLVGDSPYLPDTMLSLLTDAAPGVVGWTECRLDGRTTVFFEGREVDGGYETLIPAPDPGVHTLEYWSWDSNGAEEEPHHVATLTVLPRSVDDSHDIRVRVVDDGTPVSGVSLVLCDNWQGEEEWAHFDREDGYTAVTDADGYAVWPSMPGTRNGYRVRTLFPSSQNHIEPPTAMAFVYEAIPGYVGDVPERVLDVSGQQRFGSPVSISVIVRDSTGNPVSDARVWAEAPDGAAYSGPGEPYVDWDPVTWELRVLDSYSDAAGGVAFELLPTFRALRVHASDPAGNEIVSGYVYADYTGKTVQVDLTLGAAPAPAAAGPQALRLPGSYGL